VVAVQCPLEDVAEIIGMGELLAGLVLYELVPVVLDPEQDVVTPGCRSGMDLGVLSEYVGAKSTSRSW